MTTDEQLRTLMNLKSAVVAAEIVLTSWPSANWRYQQAHPTGKSSVSVRTIRGNRTKGRGTSQASPAAPKPSSGPVHPPPGHARIRFLSAPSLCQATATRGAVANP